MLTDTAEILDLKRRILQLETERVEIKSAVIANAKAQHEAWIAEGYGDGLGWMEYVSHNLAKLLGITGEE